ncbi:glycosyltransferase family protein [Salix suchowensis]|nr:glycosyltransferase family protein [Salix suchowensis]
MILSLRFEKSSTDLIPSGRQTTAKYVHQRSGKDRSASSGVVSHQEVFFSAKDRYALRLAPPSQMNAAKAMGTTRASSTSLVLTLGPILKDFPSFYRYLWYLIRVTASVVYRPVPLPENPTYIASEDVTIIVPTIDAGEEFKEAANSWLVGKPKEILIITEEKMLGPLQELANAVDPERIRVLTVPFANKRLQMSHGIKNTTTDIIVFADDDAIWPPTLLPYTLACFEDQKVGGVGTSQRVQSVGKRMTVWEVLAAFRLTIRNIEISASTHIDGGLPCLSGRTAAYRTVILKDPNSSTASPTTTGWVNTNSTPVTTSS